MSISTGAMSLWLIALLVFQGSSFEMLWTPSSPSPAFLAAPASPSLGPGAGPWEVVKPEAVGLDVNDLHKANEFINHNVKQRSCFLLIKNGKIAYEWYDPTAPDPPLSPKWNGSARDKPHDGYSMTKTVGGFLLLMAATEDGLELDVDITEKYNVPSPKPYGVTLRMIMAQVLGGDLRPGEMWEYDNLGTMWLHVFPQVIRAATGHNASYYMDRMHKRLGLSKQFIFPNVDSNWFTGASGSCRDWARFGQLILNGGMWDGKPLIASKWIDQMQQPVKVAPYNTYSNPCYGLLVWLNADKRKYPGCCWEASRLPEPHCNNETFMDGAVTDLTLNIGLYGQVVMTLPSVNTVVVGFGNDLRPIEPVQIGYYPGVCKALGIPCNKPPPVPPTKCEERLECTGVSAQCFSGGSWSHAEPEPGKEQCVTCFQNRLPLYEERFPEAKYMVADSCPNKTADAMKYIACFCGLTGINANPFGPWRTTTNTTPRLSPAPPLPPPTPTPAPPSPGPACGLTPKCIQGLEANYDCWNMPRNGGHTCYKGIDLHHQTLMSKYGCPNFMDEHTPVLQSKAFCWCGLDPTWPSDLAASLPLAKPQHFHNALALSDNMPQLYDQEQVLVKAQHGGLCHNRGDAHIRNIPQSWIEARMFACGQSQYGPQHGGGPPNPTACMWGWFQLMGGCSYGCAFCFGNVVTCGHEHCLEQCACGQTNACRQCVKAWCETPFKICSGDYALSTNVTFVPRLQDSRQPNVSDEEYV